jgi:ABC-type multidrug transport system fused ATPase/permease subunit
LLYGVVVSIRASPYSTIDKYLKLETFMSTDTALIEKREELKRRLAAGEYKTLVDVFLASTDHLIRKIIRRPKPLPIWFITIILIFVLLLISSVATYVAGEETNISKIIEPLGFEHGSEILLGIGILAMAIFSAVFLNHYVGRILVLWRDDILGAIESMASLEEFEDWLEKACNRRLHLLVAITGSLFATLFTVIPLNKQLGIFVGYGLTFGTLIGNMWVWSFVYQLFVVGRLSIGLRRYDLKLFAADPASSEIMSRLSSELTYVVYFVAVFAAVITLTMALPGLLPSYGILLVLSYWLALIAIFTLNQTSLSSIIRRAKWKTLNEIQAKVEKLQALENFENKETMEAINRLMDYHDRVKATRDSALDFRAYLGFINSLLLPLLALILGNLDLVLKLFSRNP